MWGCTACSYTQDFEPTIENMREAFNDDKNTRLSDCGAFECPSCALRGERDMPMKEMVESKTMIITL